ncbi:MAG: alkyl hydroperoxide reductase subunit F [Xanthomonadales bacterium]|nr:alkyl hydroperoxide reductase subunit F [Xanthomonadales bacterium]
MLDTDLTEQLRNYLTRLVEPIELVAALDGSEAALELDALLHEIAALSPKIRVLRDDADARKPSFLIRRPGDAGNLRFAGMPLGHEFTSLVLALLQVGGHPPKQSEETLAQVRALTGEYQFETYFSQSCQNCPDVVQALNLMAVLNPRIRHVAIDGALFQAEVDARQVMAVPSVFLNGQPFASGRMDLAQILARLDGGSAAREAERLRALPAYDLLVVGGGPAGAAAAIYAARKGIRTGVVAERFGGQVLDTLAIENFVSVRETEGPKLAAALEAHVLDYGVEILNGQRAAALDAADAEGLIGIRLDNGATLKSRAVVLAPGARWRSMNVPGEAEYRNRGVAYCPHCDGPLFKGKRVAVIGGGNSGVEAAIDLAGIAAHVTLIEFDARLRADEVLQRKLRSLANVRVVLSALTTEVHGDGSRVVGLSYQDRGGGGAHRVELDGIFVQIGLLPNSEWLKGSLELSPRGEIVIDAHGATSLPGVFAAGDATTVPYKQIVIAMGAGATAALAAFDHLIRSSAPNPALAAAA